MSKVIVTTDTETKEISVSVDGNSMSADNVYISKCQYKNFEGEEILAYSVCFTQYGKNGDMNTVLTYCHDSHQMVEMEDMEEGEASAELAKSNFKSFKTKLMPKLGFKHHVSSAQEFLKRLFS